MTVDVIILNRNLRVVTDALADSLNVISEVHQVYVVDSGSAKGEVSALTFVRDDSQLAIANGLRINRGFNLGLSTWLTLESDSTWVLLLPNDSELVFADFPSLLGVASRTPELVAILPTSQDNAYAPLIDETGIALAWNFHEGPLLVRSDFVRAQLMRGATLFDSANFRGFASFLELSFQVYASDRCLGVTNLIQFKENTSHLLTQHALIGTEPQEENLSKLIQEGKEWLVSKYGFSDRRNLELATRLLFEEFCIGHPEIVLKPAL